METWHSAIVRSQNCSHFCHWTRFSSSSFMFFYTVEWNLVSIANRVDNNLDNSAPLNFRVWRTGKPSSMQIARHFRRPIFTFHNVLPYHNISWSRFTIAKIKIKRRTGRHALSQFISHLNKLLPIRTHDVSRIFDYLIKLFFFALESRRSEARHQHHCERELSNFRLQNSDQLYIARVAKTIINNKHTRKSSINFYLFDSKLKASSLRSKRSKQFQEFQEISIRPWRLKHIGSNIFQVS